MVSELAQCTIRVQRLRRRFLEKLKGRTGVQVNEINPRNFYKILFQKLELFLANLLALMFQQLLYYLKTVRT